MIATATFVPERMQAAADEETTAATDLAEYLVRAGTPFRDAHAIVGAHVRATLAGEGSLRELVAADPLLGPDAAALVGPGVGVRMRTLTRCRRPGGVAAAARVVPGDDGPRRGATGPLSLTPLPVGRGSPATRPDVAPDLLDKLLVVERDGTRVSGRIVETEAYLRDDAGEPFVQRCDGSQRGDVRPAGRLYVYLSYGIHRCANVVTGVDGDGQRCCCGRWRRSPDST